MSVHDRAPDDTCDLGELSGPVLVFGGPYGNLEATEALLAAAERHRVPPKRCLCTGDTVAYCASPAETVARLRAAAVPVVMGNVEEALAAAAADCRCGFAEGSTCASLSAHWYAHARDHLDDDALAWMGRLPRCLTFTLEGRRLAVVHGAPSAINRFLFPSAATLTLGDEIGRGPWDGVLAGHSGIPFARLIDGRLWCNAGAIGLPANDGTPRVWYALLRPLAGAIVVEHHALTYDHAKAAARIRAAGLPEGYARALETGLWPSLDVLPESERAATGLPLDPPTALWPRPRTRRRAS